MSGEQPNRAVPGSSHAFYGATRSSDRRQVPRRSFTDPTWRSSSASRHVQNAADPLIVIPTSVRHNRRHGAGGALSAVTRGFLWGGVVLGASISSAAARLWWLVQG
jgi:hypothetical protein